jgi:hypothetical protein
MARPRPPHFLLERECDGPVCGVDEAGRGPWAGPVYAGAVILDPRRTPKGLNDSKKLNSKTREALEIEIKKKAVAWGVGFATVEEIATLNVCRPPDWPCAARWRPWPSSPHARWWTATIPSPCPAR